MGKCLHHRPIMGASWNNEGTRNTCTGLRNSCEIHEHSYLKNSTGQVWAGMILWDYNSDLLLCSPIQFLFLYYQCGDWTTDWEEYHYTNHKFREYFRIWLSIVWTKFKRYKYSKQASLSLPYLSFGIGKNLGLTSAESVAAAELKIQTHLCRRRKLL